MRYIYYKDDFKVTLEFKDGDTPTPLDNVDFRGKLYTAYDKYSEGIPFSRINGDVIGCDIGENGSLTIVADNHGFKAGKLMVDMKYYIYDSEYPDGKQTIARTYDLKVWLTTSQKLADGERPIEVNAIINLPLEVIVQQVKDLTEKGEQIVADADTAITNVNTAIERANTAADSASEYVERYDAIAGALPKVTDTFEGAYDNKGLLYVVRKNKLIAILKDGHVEYAPEGIAFVDAIAPTSFSIGSTTYEVPAGESYVELGLTTPITTELYQKGIYNVTGIRRFGLYLDGSKNTSLGLTFSSSADLEWLDLSGLDTSAVTYGFAVARQNPKLHTIVGKLQFPKATAIDSIFMNNTSLVNIDVSEMDLGVCRNLGNMFRSCSSLTTLDLSNWNTGACETMYNIFAYCSSLASLDVSGWGTGACTNMQGVFSDCSSLTALDVSGWNTAACTTMQSMFNGCSSLTSLDASGWDTAACTNMQYMFNGCSSLTTLRWPMMGKIKADATNNKNISLFNSPLDRASLDSIFSYDRTANGLTKPLTVQLSATSKALLSAEDIAAITAKGYTIV